MLKEFKEFAVKGNMVDMAVGIIIGAAFGAVVKSLVSDIIMPIIGLLTGGVNFQNHFIVLKAAKNGLAHFHTVAEAAKAGAVTWNYGNFINLIITFLIVSFAVFLLVKVVNRLRRQQPEPAPATPPKEEQLLTEIRDLLKAK